MRLIGALGTLGTVMEFELATALEPTKFTATTWNVYAAPSINPEVMFVDVPLSGRQLP